MTISTHAAAAKQIRNHIKSLGIKARVTCSSYSMGSSVSVTVTDLTPELYEKIKSFANQYQHGHFDGMQDIYEFSNSRNDIPQVKYVMTKNEASTETKQKIWDFIKRHHSGMDDAPISALEARKFLHESMNLWGDMIISRLFHGGFNNNEYWDSLEQKQPKEFEVMATLEIEYSMKVMATSREDAMSIAGDFDIDQYTENDCSSNVYDAVEV